MAAKLQRVLLGMCWFAIGMLAACLVVPAFLLQAILGGRKGISKLFKRGKHEECPKLAKSYQHCYVKTKSGLKFHYVRTGSMDSPLMICLHGFPECWYSWKYVLDRFQSDYHVVAIDMRGYGDSYKPNSVGEYHITYLVNDVKEIINALGYDQAVIVAHDWGGVVAWEVAMFFPKVVDKLVIMNAPNKGYYDFVKQFPSQLLKSWYFFFFLLPFIPELLIGYNDFKQLEDSFRGRGPVSLKNKSNILSMEEVEIYKHYAMRFVHYGINYYRAMNPLYTGMKLDTKKRAVVDRPTLVIWGSEDSALDVRMVSFLKSYVENGVSKIIEGAGHWVLLDEPEQVMDAVKEFLTSK